MNVAIVYYQKGEQYENTIELAKNIKAVIGDDCKVICMPKDYDVMLNCSVDQLVTTRNIIEEAIIQKLIEDQPSSSIKH